MADNITAYNNSLSPEEASEKSRIAGRRSGEIRRNNKILRDQLHDDLGGNPELVADICRALEERARRGDVRAFEAIRNTIDPAWKNEPAGGDDEHKIIVHVVDDDGAILI